MNSIIEKIKETRIKKHISQLEFDYDEGIKTFMGSEWIQCPECKGTNIKDNYPEETELL